MEIKKGTVLKEVQSGRIFKVTDVVVKVGLIMEVDVWVVNGIDKTSFTLEAIQAGVLNNLILVYNH